MTRPSDPNRSGDLLLLAAVGLLATASGGHWLVGNVAALMGRGRLLHAGVPDAMAALTRLPEHWSDPRRAWSEPAASNLPGPVIYWASVAVVAVVAVVIAALAVNVVNRRRHQPVDQRRRLGVEAQPPVGRQEGATGPADRASRSPAGSSSPVGVGTTSRRRPQRADAAEACAVRSP